MARKYLLTDSCYFYGKKKRCPHYVEVVDLETGAVKRLKSGSIVRILKEKK